MRNDGGVVEGAAVVDDVLRTGVGSGISLKRRLGGWSGVMQAVACVGRVVWRRADECWQRVCNRPDEHRQRLWRRRGRWQRDRLTEASTEATSADSTGSMVDGTGGVVDGLDRPIQASPGGDGEGRLASCGRCDHRWLAALTDLECARCFRRDERLGLGRGWPGDGGSDNSWVSFFDGEMSSLWSSSSAGVTMGGMAGSGRGEQRQATALGGDRRHRASAGGGCHGCRPSHVYVGATKVLHDGAPWVVLLQ
ncbi:hypothetical protein ACLOJK_019174 [Asimina triloba]